MFAGGELVARRGQMNVEHLRDTAGVGVERDDTVAEIDRFLKIVRNEHDRRLAHGDQPQDFILQCLARHGIECAERLVHQQYCRLLREAACDLHTLLHAAGKLRRIMSGMIGEADLGEQFLDARATLRGGHVVGFQRQRDIAGGGAPGQQSLAVILEHKGDFFFWPVHRPPVEQHLSLAGRQQSAHHTQQRRLATARGADQADEFGLSDGEIDIAHNRTRSEIVIDALELDQRLSRGDGMRWGRGLNGHVADIALGVSMNEVAVLFAVFSQYRCRASGAGSLGKNAACLTVLF